MQVSADITKLGAALLMIWIGDDCEWYYTTDGAGLQWKTAPVQAAFVCRKAGCS
jgi:hypothetical protein